VDPNIVAAHANLGVVLVPLAVTTRQSRNIPLLLRGTGSPELRLNLASPITRKVILRAVRTVRVAAQEDPGNLRVATLLGNCQVQLAS